MKKNEAKFIIARILFFLPVSIYSYRRFLPAFSPYSANLSLRSAYPFFLRNHTPHHPCPPKRRVHQRQIPPHLPKLRRELCEARPVSARLFYCGQNRLDWLFFFLKIGVSS